MKIKAIINYFGLNTQKKKFLEESGELFEAITEYQMMCRRLEGKPPAIVNKEIENYRKHIIEESADVIILISQFLSLLEVDEEELTAFINYKVERTGRRYGLFRESKNN